MGGRSNLEAKAIYQKLLDNITDCYLTENFDNFQRYIHVPHHFRTATDTFVVRDEIDLKAIFERYIKHCTELGLTDYIRTCSEARFFGQDRIQGTHESHMLRRATLINPVFNSTSVLMRIGQRWMVCASENRLPATSTQGLAMREALQQNAIADIPHTLEGNDTK